MPSSSKSVARILKPPKAFNFLILLVQHLLLFIPLSTVFGQPTADGGRLRLQGVAVQGRLLCGKQPLVNAKVKIVDLDPRPDRDDLLGEFLTNDQGLFQVSGATKEESDIQVVLKIYHDCLDEERACQRRTVWHIPAKYYNNGTLTEWMDIGSINMEMGFPHEERDCRH